MKEWFEKKWNEARERKKLREKIEKEVRDKHFEEYYKEAYKNKLKNDIEKRFKKGSGTGVGGALKRMGGSLSGGVKEARKKGFLVPDTNVIDKALYGDFLSPTKPEKKIFKKSKKLPKKSKEGKTIVIKL